MFTKLELQKISQLLLVSFMLGILAETNLVCAQVVTVKNTATSAKSSAPVTKVKAAGGGGAAR